jgi:N-acetylneuraminate synthase
MKPEPTYIIAEAGVNHNGSIEIAKKLINVAADAGADAIKFQTFKAERLVSRSAPKAEYQTKTTNALETQLDMIRSLELDKTAHEILIEHSRRSGIQFLSTPFDNESVDLLARTFDLPFLKLSSGEITNAPLLLKVAKTGKPVVMSTGMSTLGEIEDALGVLAFGYLDRKECPSINLFRESYTSEGGQTALREKVTLLHCTTEYPAPYADVNLRAMDAMRNAFGLPVGFSDHTIGIAVPLAAVARGAVVIEKHFTLDKSLPGPDHKASLEPFELKEMVHAIKVVEQAMGSPVKKPAPSEFKNIAVARKSLVALCSILMGEHFTNENLTVKRPGHGVSPFRYWDFLNKPAQKAFEKDELVI